MEAAALRRVARHPHYRGERNHRYAAGRYAADVAKNPSLHTDVWWELMEARPEQETAIDLVARPLGWLQIEHVFEAGHGNVVLMALAAHNQLGNDECEMLDIPRRSSMYRTLRNPVPARCAEAWPRRVADASWRYSVALADRYGAEFKDWPVNALLQWEAGDFVTEVLGEHLGDDPTTWDTAISLAPDWSGTATTLAEAVQSI